MNIFDKAFEQTQKTAMSLDDVRAKLSEVYTNIGATLNGSGAAGKFVMDNAGNIARGLGGAAVAGAGYALTAGRRPYESEEDFRNRRSGGAARSAILGGLVGGLAVPGYEFATQTLPDKLKEWNRKIMDADREKPTGPELVMEQVKGVGKGVGDFYRDPGKRDAAGEMAGFTGAVAGTGIGVGVGRGVAGAATRSLIPNPAMAQNLSQTQTAIGKLEAKGPLSPRDARTLAGLKRLATTEAGRLHGRPGIRSAVKGGGGILGGLIGAPVGYGVGQLINDQYFNHLDRTLEAGPPEFASN